MNMNEKYMKVTKYFKTIEINIYESVFIVFNVTTYGHHY